MHVDILWENNNNSNYFLSSYSTKMAILKCTKTILTASYITLNIISLTCRKMGCTNESNSSNNAFP